MSLDCARSITWLAVCPTWITCVSRPFGQSNSSRRITWKDIRAAPLKERGGVRRNQRAHLYLAVKENSLSTLEGAMRKGLPVRQQLS